MSLFYYKALYCEPLNIETFIYIHIHMKLIIFHKSE